jgi:hypothetical protein
MNILTLHLLILPLVIVGTILGNLITKWLTKQPQRLVYTVDITLRNEGESMDDFIYRAYNERLGQYRIA